MPLYEYRCQDCDRTFETIVSSHTKADEVTCTKCGSANVRRSISAGSFRLSGSSNSIPSGALSGCSSKGGFS